MRSFFTRPFFSRTAATLTALACLVAAAAMHTQPIHAQHIDVLAQVDDGKIVTGAADVDTNTWTIGETVFQRQLLSNFRSNDPGFTGLETGNPLLPSGIVGFAPQTDLFIDIVPSTIGGQRANFWYWNGSDEDQNGFTMDDVNFGLAPAGITWNMFDDDFDLHTADGSDTVVPDVFAQTTFSDGGIHQHLLIQIDDGDGNSGTTPPEGVFLASMVLRADGYEDSAPFFFVHRTSGLTNDPRNVATDWARLHYENLIRLPGDYNGDGMVDVDDYTLWATSFGSSAVPFGAGADGNTNGLVDAADFTFWRDRYAETIAVTTVPEPACVPMILMGLCLLCPALPRRKR